MAKRKHLTIIEIEDRVKRMLKSNEGFDISAFASLFDFSSVSVTRAKNAFANGAPFVIKNKIYYDKVDTDILLALDEVEQSYSALKSKPRIILICGRDSIAALDTKTKDTLSIKLTELASYAEFFLVWNGIERIDYQAENQADRKAAERIAKVYDIVAKDNPDANSHAFNLFLIRILFLLFAEDTGIMDKSIFTNVLKNRTNADGSDFNEVIRDLFRILDIPSHDRGESAEWLRSFPYVNGKLFEEQHIDLTFSKESRKLLIEAGELLNWNDINPDILGSMIQAVASVETRHSAGMHYTSVPNIMKVIKPLFLDALTEEYNKLHSKYKENELKHITDKTRQDNKKNILSELYILHSRISNIKFLDPACGSGNFLIIAYKEIRRLEIKIMRLISQIESKGIMPISLIHLGNFYGIEIDDFAHEVAKLSLWIAEHQMDIEMKKFFPASTANILPLKEAGNIVQGNALHIDWETILPHNLEDEIYIMGNPPYNGARKKNTEQKKDLEKVLKKYKVSPGNIDYIAAWFIKGSEYISGTKAKLAMVSTNSIVQGVNVALWPEVFKNGVEINFAYQSFRWRNNAKDNAGVIVVIIGLSGEPETQKWIFSDSSIKSVYNISPYLTEGDNIVVKQVDASISGLPDMLLGSMANDGGNLIMSQEEYENLISDNPETKDIIRKFIGSKEYINSLIKYIIYIDNDNIEDWLTIPEVANRVKKVEIHRMKSSREETRKLAITPHRIAESRHQDKTKVIVPRVSSENRRYVPMGFLDKTTVVKDSAMVIYDAPMWLLGLLESRMHMVWLRAIGGKLKTDYRYSATLVYNTFPILNLSAQRKNEIARVMTEILDLREFEGGTLANLYDNDKMPESLRKKHEELDGIVDRAYRQQKFESDEERLSVLLQLYKEMTANVQ